MSPIRMSKIESGMRVVLEFNEAFNRHDVAAMMKLMSEDCVFENTSPAPNGTVYSGKEAVTQFWLGFFRESPQAKIEIEEIFGFGKICIGRGLDNYNTQQAGDGNFQRICFAVQSSMQEIVGGALGELYWGWFHLDLLWVKEEFRRQGYGHRLLEQIEAEAQKRGAKHVYLDTFSFQAPEFYKKHGYRIYGELQDFPPGHQRYFFTKGL